MLSARVVRAYSTRYPEMVASINKHFLEEEKITMVGEVKRRVPVKTGQLKNSIHGRVKDDQLTIGTNVNYATHVEYGTVKMSAQPFMRPAIDDNRRRLVTRWRQLFRKTFRALGRM